MYKYVNKKNISITVGGISFTPYSGYTSYTPVPALDATSNGWDFDRYYNEVLTNTSNDDTPIGEIRYFPSNPGNGWLKCDGTTYLRTDYPALSTVTTQDGYDITSYIGDGILAPNDFSGGYTGIDGKLYVKDYSSSNRHMWSTSDKGLTWTKHIDMLPVATWYYYFYSNGASLMVAWGNANNIAYSNDGGLTWAEAAVPPTNPTSLKLSEISFDGTKFVLVSTTSFSQGIVTGKFIAHSIDGSNWTTIALPANCQTQDWVTCRSGTDGITHITADNAQRIQFYNGSVNGPYTNYGRASLGRGADYCYKQIALSHTVTVDYFGKLNISNGYSLIETHPLGVAESVRGLYKVSNIIMCVGNSGGLFISFDSGYSWNYRKLAFPIINGIDGLAGGSDFAVVTTWASSLGNYVTYRWQVNTLKFCVPGLPDTANTSPYVYAGA